MRFLKKSKRFWTVTLVELRIWLLVGVAIVAVAVMAILLFSPYFNVREIHVRRQDARVDIEEVQKILTPLFSERLVFISRARVRDLLTTEFPDLDRVEIAKDYPSTLTVTVVLDPVLVRIGIDMERGSGSALSGSGVAVHRYVTEDGYLVFSPIALADEPTLALELTDWGLLPENRTKIFDPEDLRTVLLAGDILRRDFGLETRRTLFFLRAREFHIVTNKGEIWFDLGSLLSVQLERFRQFLSEASFDDVTKYIDLRIADKIIYR